MGYVSKKSLGFTVRVQGLRVGLLDPANARPLYAKALGVHVAKHEVTASSSERV